MLFYLMTFFGWIANCYGGGTLIFLWILYWFCSPHRFINEWWEREGKQAWEKEQKQKESDDAKVG